MGRGEAVADRFEGLVRAYVLVASDVRVPADGRILRDETGDAARMYDLGPDPAVIVVRPDGYVGFVAQDPALTQDPAPDTLTAYLGRTLRFDR